MTTAIDPDPGGVDLANRARSDDPPAQGAGRRPWRDRIDVPVTAALTAAFVLSRIAYALAGVRYDASLLPTALQYLEPEHLEHRLLESVFYQHTQPPLFNLLLGVVLKLPFPTGATLQVLWLACGAALVALVYVLARDLGLSRWVAVAVAVVICCSPTTILYENWLAYEYPLTTLLTGMCVAAFRWIRDGSPAAFTWFVALAGVGALTRALLHPLWFAFAIGVLLLARPPTRASTAARPLTWRRASAVIALPTLLILGVLVKNQLVFGEPTMSSWFPWNLSRITIAELPDDVRQRLVEEGTISETANYPVFLPYEDYVTVAPPCTPAHPDVPVLAETEKVNGHINPNYECYLPLLDQYAHDSVAAGLAEPGYAARAVLGSFQIWVESASQYAFVYDNRLHIDGFDERYRQIVLLDVPWDPPITTDAGWWIPIGTPGRRWRFSVTIVVSTIAAVSLAMRALWRRRRGELGAIDGTLLVIGYQVAAITLIGNAFEIGENNRFRFMVEPITLVVGAYCVVALVRRAYLARQARLTTTAVT